MLLIDFITGLCIPCELFIDFSASRLLNRPVDLHFGPKKDEKWYFPPKWRLKVHSLHCKCFWSTLLVNYITLVTILLFSVNSDASIDLWTSILGPNRTKNGIFRQNEGLRSLIWVLNVLIDFISKLCMPCDHFIVFSASRYLNRPADLHFGPKNNEKQYFWSKWWLKVQNLDCKWFWSTLSVGCGFLWSFLVDCVSCEHFIDFSASRHLNRPKDLHFGPKRDEKWYFLPKWRL